MLQRIPAVLAVLVLAAAFAGCVKDEPPADTTTTPPTGGTSATTTPTGGTGTGGNATPRPANPAPVTEKGAINGPFEKSWKINVPAISPKAMTILFNLTGAQAGAPPTAVVHLALTDPENKVIKQATIGLGQSGDKVAWPFGPAEIALVGEYTLAATAQPSPLPSPGGLPSGGIANYELTATVEY